MTKSKSAAQPARRTDAIDAAIGKLDAQIRDLMHQRRLLVRDMKVDPAQISEINARLGALRDQIEGQREIRREAEALDKRDHFLRERERIRQLSESTLQLLGSREVAARKIDAAMLQIGQALEEIGAANRQAWNDFTDVVREIAPNKRLYEQATYSNQSRILTAAHCADALAYGLKAAGVGTRGVSCDLLYPVSTYRGGTAQSLEDAMHEANEKVERHLAILFRQAGELAAGSEGDAVQAETEPAAVVDYSQPWASRMVE